MIDNGSLFLLLEDKEIVHPTAIQEILISNNSVALKLKGYPWWLPFEQAKKMKTSSAKIEFYNVNRSRLTESCLTSSSFMADDESSKEDLEEFSITNMVHAPWNQGNLSTVFCSSPIKDPIALLMVLDQFLARTNCPFDREEFIHHGGDIGNFIELTKLNLFQLAKGPKAICKSIVEELERQGVKYTMTEVNVVLFSGYLVQWWDGFLICEDATISWDLIAD